MFSNGGFIEIQVPWDSVLMQEDLKTCLILPFNKRDYFISIRPVNTFKAMAMLRFPGFQRLGWAEQWRVSHGKNTALNVSYGNVIRKHWLQLM